MWRVWPRVMPSRRLARRNPDRLRSGRPGPRGRPCGRRACRTSRPARTSRSAPPRPGAGSSRRSGPGPCSRPGRRSARACGPGDLGLADLGVEGGQIAGDRGPDDEVVERRLATARLSWSFCDGLFQGHELDLPEFQVVLLAFDRDLLLFRTRYSYWSLASSYSCREIRSSLSQLGVAFVDALLLLEGVLDVVHLLAEVCILYCSM